REQEPDRDQTPSLRQEKPDSQLSLTEEPEDFFGIKGESKSSDGRIPRQSAPAQILRIIDGDTIIVRADLGSGPKEYPIRIRGVDTPENAFRDEGKKARDALEALLKGKRVTLGDYTTDQTGRRVAANVVVEGTGDVGKWLVEQGYGDAPLA